VLGPDSLSGFENADPTNGRRFFGNNWGRSAKHQIFKDGRVEMDMLWSLA